LLEEGMDDNVTTSCIRISIYYHPSCRHYVSDFSSSYMSSN
jgi:hypothetical protein